MVQGKSSGPSAARRSALTRALSALLLFVWMGCQGATQLDTGVVSCSPGTTDCDGVCTVTDFDPGNCGTCGKACVSPQVCSVGQCGSQCVGGTILCGSLCVTTQSDPANCGGCGKVCASGEVCSAGQCGSQCLGGSTKCGLSCVDTQNDPGN